jgi:zinc and cadmium transporter
MNALIPIIESTFLVSLISLIGIITLIIKKKLFDKILLLLVGFSAGALMGGAFLHLIPEAIEKSVKIDIFLNLLFGFVLFFFLEKLLYWRHCHDEKCKVHAFSYLNLVGDFVHNFIDGLIIAASFITDINLGISTTLAIAFHEIPQEIGDFGVLVYGGFKKSKALILNFLTALSAILGGIIGYVISSHIEYFTTFLLPFAAGGFIYIASSDLIPEIKNIEDLKKSMLTFSVFLMGISFMWVARVLFV